jgi:hypothetical protein
VSKNNPSKARACGLLSHLWGEWTLNESNCRETRICNRCQKRETRDAIHAWGQWEYQVQPEGISDNWCVEIRECQHCQLTELRKQSLHEWDAWAENDNPCSEIRKCKCCGQVEKRGRPHAWEKGKVERLNPNERKIIFSVVCSLCLQETAWQEELLFNLFSFEDQCENYQGMLPCGSCHGQRLAGVKCSRCFGRGKSNDNRTCPECHGYGIVIPECSACKGLRNISLAERIEQVKAQYRISRFDNQMTSFSDGVDFRLKTQEEIDADQKAFDDAIDGERKALDDAYSHSH